MHASHVALHTWDGYLRIVDVPSHESYLSDFLSVYPDAPSNEMSLVYNAAPYYKRLLSDIVFKKFKGFRLDSISEGVWKVESTAGILQELEEYIRKKLSHYKEDCDSTPKEEIAAVEKFDWTPYIEQVRDGATLNVTGYAFKGGLPVQGGLLLTYRHLAAALWCAVDNFINATAPQAGAVVFTEDGPVVPAETIDIGALLATIGFTAEDIYAKNKQWPAMESSAGDPQPYDPHFCVFAPVYSYVDGSTPTCSFAIGVPQPVAEEQPKKTSNIYKNAITGKTLVSEKPLDSLKELARVATIEASTDFGRSVIGLSSGLSITKQDVDDLGAIYAQLRLLFPADAKAEPKATSSPHDVMQALFTQSYVNRFKDDASETNASSVVSQVSQYLGGLMLPHEINKNSISKDMVEMGVKKTRKSHGYVYGIKSASDEEIISAIAADKLG